MHRGYIKLWRKTLDSGLLQNGPAWQLFGYLLLKAVYHPQRRLVGSSVYDLEPGQLIFSRAKAAADLKLGEQQVRTAVSLLKKLEVITSASTNQCTVITITNWPLYQAEQPTSNQRDDTPSTGEATNGQPTPNQRVTSDASATDQIKESKNINNIKLRSASGGADAAHAPAAVSDGKAGDAPDLPDEGEAAGARAAKAGPEGAALPGNAEKGKPEAYRTRKGRTLTGKRLISFLRFWEAFAYPRGKAEAADAWLDIPALTDALVARICAAARKEAERREELVARGHTPKMAQGWISGRRWEDYEPERPPERTEDAGTRPLRAVYDDGRPVEGPPTPEERAANERRMAAMREKLRARGLIRAECPTEAARAG